MKLLLDTHVLLWWLADHPSLPDEARTAIAEPGNEVLVSAATVWEIAIKQETGRLDAPTDLLDALATNEFDPLPITAAHAVLAATLPQHHLDPFDRMLVAQARLEGLRLASVDERVRAYEVDVLPVR